jgi:hypothetical protein
MTTALGNAAELLVVLVNESSRMASYVSNRSSRDPVGVSETIEASSDEHTMDSGARSSQERAESVWTVSGPGSSVQDLSLRRLG